MTQITYHLLDKNCNKKQVFYRYPNSSQKYSFYSSIILTIKGGCGCMLLKTGNVRFPPLNQQVGDGQIIFGHCQATNVKNSLIAWIWASWQGFLSASLYLLMEYCSGAVCSPKQVGKSVHHQWSSTWTNCIPAGAISVAVPQMRNFLQLPLGEFFFE